MYITIIRSFISPACTSYFKNSYLKKKKYVAQRVKDTAHFDALEDTADQKDTRREVITNSNIEVTKVSMMNITIMMAVMKMRELCRRLSFSFIIFFRIKLSLHVLDFLINFVFMKSFYYMVRFFLFIFVLHIYFLLA